MLISSKFHKRSTEVSIKTRSSPASFSFKGQAVKHNCENNGLVHSPKVGNLIMRIEYYQRLDWVIKLIVYINIT